MALAPSGLLGDASHSLYYWPVDAAPEIGSMRIVRNVGYVKRRKRVAKWSALLGLTLLIAVFVLALNPRYLLFAYAMLFGGFILFNSGMQQVGKWSRNPRNDVALDMRLSGLSDKYALIHYAQLGKRTVEHMLLHPGGVLVITARELPGRIVARKGRWRKKGVGIGRLFGMSGPQLGNPVYETTQSIATVEAHLAAHQLQVDVSGVVVFVSPLVNLEVEDPTYPALKIEELADFVWELPADASVRQNERDALLEALAIGERLEVSGQRKNRRPVKSRRPVKKRAA